MKDGLTENVFIGERKMKKFSKKTIDTNWKRYNREYDSSRYTLSEKMSYNEFIETMQELRDDEAFKRSKKSYASAVLQQNRLLLNKDLKQYRQFAESQGLSIGINLYSSKKEIEDYRKMLHDVGMTSEDPAAYWALYEGTVVR